MSLRRYAGLVAVVSALLVACAGPARRRPPPIDDRPITIDARCTQRDDDGFREDSRLQVIDGRVLAMTWKLSVGRSGNCSFAFDQFRQTRTRPHAELLARDGSGCKLMIWQDPSKITLAHAGCQSYCSVGVYEQAWPTMFDPATGGCAAGR
jgi:hypothetical protein